MTNTKQNKTKPVEIASNAAQDSQTQPSAQAQKNIPQNNTTEESKPISQLVGNSTLGLSSRRSKLSASEIITMDKESVVEWLENPETGSRQLKGVLDLLSSAIQLRKDILSDEKNKSKKIPSVDRRIETLVLFDNQIETGERYLSENNKIKLQNELTNLKEKQFLVRQKFVKVVGSEKKTLKFEGLRAKAKSKLYHSKSSYFIKQRILKILNAILKDDKSGLEEVKNLANSSSEESIKLFNEKMRGLLEVYDEDLVILCSHVQRESYFNIMRLTLMKWNPETDLEITALVDPNES